MKYFLLILACTPVLAAAAGLIGSTIPPAPAGLVHRQGVCIAQGTDFEHACDYSIGILESADGKPVTLFGARMTGRDSAGGAIWTVADTLPYPVLSKGYFLALATCRANGKIDNTIIATVRIQDQDWLRDILWARRFDTKLGKFVEQPVAGVECANESRGL